MPTPTTDFAKAMADAWNAGAVQRVIALAAQARAAHAENAGVLLLLGLAQQASACYPQAVATFRELAQMHPEVSAYWNNLAVTCRQAGDLVGAEQALEKALSLAPADADVHYNLGLLYTQQQLAAGPASVAGRGAIGPEFH